eukprot:4623282-Amphidinium_carterae.1
MFGAEGGCIASSSHSEVANTDFYTGLGLSSALIQGILAHGLKSPTRYQGGVVMALVRRENVVSQAPTGNGKTTAFAI